MSSCLGNWRHSLLVKYDWVVWLTVLEADESLFLLVVSWLWLAVLKETFLGVGVVRLVQALLPLAAVLSQGAFGQKTTKILGVIFK